MVKYFYLDDERSDYGNEITKDLTSLVDTFDQMKREFRSLEPKSKGVWREKLTDYENQLKNLKQRCSRIVNDSSKEKLYGKRGAVLIFLIIEI